MCQFGQTKHHYAGVIMSVRSSHVRLLAGAPAPHPSSLSRKHCNLVHPDFKLHDLQPFMPLYMTYNVVLFCCIHTCVPHVPRVPHVPS